MGSNFEQELNQPPKFEENILKAFENRKLVFFIGAGVSRIMGVPGWSDFSARLIKKAFPNYKEYSTILKEIPDSKERITIAYNKFKSCGKLEEFYSCFGENMQPDPEIFTSKENIYEILNSFDATFLTTNADNLFEEVIGSALCHENYDVDVLNNDVYKRQNHLFYLHGHYTSNIDINDNNLVFTAPQYVSRYNNPNFTKFLREIFINKDNIIVFIGYGLNEFELIDYIITKSGYTKKSDRRVYLLYGFCDNEEILYKAKLAYFEELNIGLIKYNLSNKGYDSLIDTLKSLLADYKERTIVPITEKISYCANNYNDANYAEILRLLRNEHFAKTNEPQITQEIQEQKNHTWVKRFYEDGLFSANRLSEKIKYRAWPMLELFAEWVEAGEQDAQIAALSFLESITKDQAEHLSQTHTRINYFIARTILALSKSNIKLKHISLLEKIGENNGFFYYELPQLSNYSQFVTWPKNAINKLLNAIFEKVDLDNYQDNMSYSIEYFFKNINVFVDSDAFSATLFEYLVDFVVEASKPDTYCLFLRILDLDNIKKNYQENWTTIFDEINLIFSKFNRKKQERFISKFISTNNSARIKLGIYLARKLDYKVSFSLLDAKFFSSNDYFHECYLLIKHLTKNGYIPANDADCIGELVSVANFGIDNYPNFETDEFLLQLISSKRLLLLQLLPGNKCRKMSQKLIADGVNPYPSEKTAEECDYVHIIELDNETLISENTFQDVSLEDWCSHFEKSCECYNDNYKISSCCSQFACLLAEKSKDDFSTIIRNLKNIKKRLITSVLYELRSNRHKLSAPDELIKSCLDILELMLEKDDIDQQCAKAVFATLSDLESNNVSIIKATLRTIVPWLDKTIDGEKTFNDDKKVLNNLINFGDFKKITVLLNCFASLKELCDHTVTDQELDLLLNTVKKDSINKTCKYTLCYNYQTLKYISSQKEIAISNAIFNESPFDMVALTLCVLNSSYIFKELIEIIKSEYLYGKCTLPESCKDRVLSSRFYDYIISSRYFNVISQEEFEESFKDADFLRYFLRSIHVWSSKDNFHLSDWLAPCWQYIKTNYQDDLLSEMAQNILCSADNVKIPTKEMLELYLDVSNACKKGSHVYVKIPKVLSFFEVDAAKTASLIYKLLSFGVLVKHEDIELIVLKYKEFGLDREAFTLLNMLSERGDISNKVKESIAKHLT